MNTTTHDDLCHSAEAPTVREPILEDLEWSPEASTIAYCPMASAPPRPRTKTLPYLHVPPVPPTSPAPVRRPAAPKSAQPGPRIHPPFAVAFMLLLGLMSLVTSGGMALRTLLEV